MDAAFGILIADARLGVLGVAGERTDERRSGRGYPLSDGRARNRLAEGAKSGGPAPPPPRRLAFPPADRDEQARKHMHADDEPREILMGRKHTQAQCEQGQIHREHDPALPCARQTPSPAVALRREPVAGLVGVGHDPGFYRLPLRLGSGFTPLRDKGTATSPCMISRMFSGHSDTATGREMIL